jgi:hypothetical protein
LHFAIHFSRSLYADCADLSKLTDSWPAEACDAVLFLRGVILRGKKLPEGEAHSSKLAILDNVGQLLEKIQNNAQ